jgi:histidine triad (HIT) family protein
MSNCLFCRIIAGELPAAKVYEDDQIVAFDDIQPQAPVHVLIVPRKHIPTLNDLDAADGPLVGRMVQVATGIARDRGTDTAGYRTLINVNEGGGQSVYHVHLHLLGGRQLQYGLG